MLETNSCIEKQTAEARWIEPFGGEYRAAASLKKMDKTFNSYRKL